MTGKTYENYELQAEVAPTEWVQFKIDSKDGNQIYHIIFQLSSAHIMEPPALSSAHRPAKLFVKVKLYDKLSGMLGSGAHKYY